MKPYYDRNGITIYHGDCREILPTLERFDLLLTDPPYGIGEKWKTQFKAKNGNSRLWDGSSTWDAVTVDDQTILLTVSHADQAIIWGGNYYSFPSSRCWLIWDKVQKSTAGADAELAWTNLGGTVRAFRMSRIDAYVNVGNETKQHPTQKPLSLMQWCLTFAPDAKTVLDPFMGSGTTLVAAKLAGIQATGIEINERYCEIGAKRLEQEVFDFSDGNGTGD